MSSEQLMLLLLILQNKVELQLFIFITFKATELNSSIHSVKMWISMLNVLYFKYTVSTSPGKQCSQVFDILSLLPYSVYHANYLNFFFLLIQIQTVRHVFFVSWGGGYFQKLCHQSKRCCATGFFCWVDVVLLMFLARWVRENSSQWRLFVCRESTCKCCYHGLKTWVLQRKWKLCREWMQIIYPCG